ncbi:MAG: AAA family ATPase [Coleofasciculus chthonoplastes F3-SA18-01]|uniref:AAA family ATPase n=1 Tax=Coleofasciculus chthonoplastes TaxID=64178 RepID=UPI0032F1544E
MLKKLILKNWKSFRDAELPIDPLTVLIGANASGKSNIVDALEFLNRIASNLQIKTALEGDRLIPPIRGGVEWAARKAEEREKQFTLSMLVTDEETPNEDYSYSITVGTSPYVRLLDNSLEKVTYNTINPNSVPLFWTDNSKSSDNGIYIKAKDKKGITIHSNDASSFFVFMPHLIHRRFDFEPDSRYSQEVVAGVELVWKTLDNIFILNPDISRMRNYSRLSDRLESDASNIAGVLAALSDEKKQDFESTVVTYLRHLPEGDIQRVWAEPVGRFGNDAMLYCEEEWHPWDMTVVDAWGMSDGTLRFLAILTALMTRPKGSQLVIEEVDNGLHPSRVGLLLKMLKEIGEKRNIDILVTTHNPALLDALDPGMIPFVILAYRDAETGESKLTPVEDIENFPKLYASASLGQLTAKGAIERSISRKQ